MKNLPKWLRYTLAGALTLALLGGVVYGVLLLIRGRGASVPVYAVKDVSTFASAGNAQTNGRVTTDRIQSVYVTATQEVTAVNVREGQRVSVGDALLSFDTTLTDLELERQGITLRQTELDLENAKKRLAEVNTYRVYVPPAATPDPDLIPTTVGVPRKGSGTVDDPYVYVWNDNCVFSEAFVDSLLPHLGLESVPAVYAVFEVRTGDSLMGSVQRCWEMVFYRGSDDGWVFTCIAPDYDDSTGLEDGEKEEEESYTGPTYSWSDIASMRKEAEQQIIDLELKLKVEQLKYETLQYELTNGVVTSKIDGVVKTVRSVDEARASGEPVVLVSGGGGYYVTGALSETELGAMHPGDTVSVRSWETYETLEGTITEISEFPADENSYYYHYSNGNQNVSLYPFTVFLSEDAKLREGEYVEMSYDPSRSAGSTGLCLMNAFIRTENGRSYVWVAGENGLEKREIRTGRSLWGSYLEVLSGLSSEDLVAFPYGKNLREGAPTEKADRQQLYG